jgi:uncharacterized protein (TIGR02246 family)
MKCKRNWFVAVGVLAAVAATIVLVQQMPATNAGEGERKADETDIGKVSAAFARAFEKGDAKAVGAYFTDEAEYVDDEGVTVHGRAALEKAYADFFAKRAELTVETKTDKIRFLSKDTAVEEGTFTVRAKDRPPNASRFSTLYVREDGRWRMAMLKEWGDETTNRPDLQDLAWLVGSWETEGPETIARTTYEWSESKKFLVCKFTITQKKDKALFSSGTQVIGVDPAYGMIRGWTFSSDGGIGEAGWTYDGERWNIDSHATLADGSATSALNQIKRAGDDGFTFRSVQRTLEGERQPDIGPVKVKRVK